MDNQYGGGYGQPPYQQPPNGSDYQPPGSQMPPYAPPGQNYGPGQAKKGRSGCLTGCIVVIIAIVLAIIGAGWYGWSWAKKNVLEETSLSIDVPALTEQQQDNIGKKLKPFIEAARNNTGEIFDITLTENEVNWLINNPGEDGQKKPDNYRANLEFLDTDLMAFKISRSLGNKFESGGPYLNLEGKSTLKVTDGNMTVDLKELKIGKFNLPKEFFSEFNQGFAEQLRNNPDSQRLEEVLRDLKIEKGKIILKLKAVQSEPKTLEEEK